LSELVTEVVSYAGPDGRARPALVWRLPAGTVAVTSGLLGGGLGVRRWIVNAQVPLDYDEPDPARHVGAIAAELGLPEGEGVGLLTAAEVTQYVTARDEGAECVGTVGVSVPTWAAGPDGTWSPWLPGTINLVAYVPAPLSPAAMVNAVMTVTEAKSQALAEVGIPGTGTASDAVVVSCLPGGTEPYGGPRSVWGARLARAAHQVVVAGAEGFRARHG
jgi:adenosylcobinamide amidohydrolase